MENIENTTGEVTTQTVSEEAAVSQEQSTPNALEEFIGETEVTGEADYVAEETPATMTEQSTQVTETPKGIKGRIAAETAKADKAGYERGRADLMKEYDAKFAAMEARLSAYEAKEQEAAVEAEAKEVAKAEHCSIDFARKFVMAQKGIKPKAETTTPTVVKPANNAVASDVEAKANMLMAQAKSIEDQYGIDVLSIFQNDEEAKQKVSNGDWDFRDLAMRELNKGAQRKAAPKPIGGVNTSNTTTGLDIMHMTDEQFEKFNERLKQGGVYRPPR